jgi:hypothetical protein
MITYRGELHLAEVPGGEDWELLEPVAMEWDGMEYVAPAGFRTDFASIPRLFWHLVGHPLHRSHRWEALFHDLLCRKQLMPRRRADRYFRLALLQRGGHVGPWVKWGAVRLYTEWLGIRKPVWLVFAVALLWLVCSCTSTRTRVQYSDGSAVVRETTEFCGLTVRQTEAPEVSTSDEQRQAVAVRGRALLVAGAVAAFVGLLAGLWMSNPVVMRVGHLVALGGASCVAAGAFLLGVAVWWHWAGAAVVVAGVGAVLWMAWRRARK